jgi:hypothetical protein
MLTAGLVGAHYAIMEYFRRAARDDLPTELHLRTIGKAVALCRLAERTARDLMQRQRNLVLRRSTALPAPPPRTPAPRARRAPPRSRPAGPPQHDRPRENPMHQALRAQAAALAAATAKAIAA